MHSYYALNKCYSPNFVLWLVLIVIGLLKFILKKACLNSKHRVSKIGSFVKSEMYSVQLITVFQTCVFLVHSSGTTILDKTS